MAFVRPRRSASIAVVSTCKVASFSQVRRFRSLQRCEMRNPTSIAELHKKFGTPSSETAESLRLLKAFLKLGAGHRFEIVELVERIAMEETTLDHPLS